METKISIGLPTNRLTKPKTAESLLRLIAKTKLNILPIVSTRGYTTAENRNYIATKATNEGCTHLFFVDDDMIYEEDTLDRLLAHDKDIIGGVAFTKYEKQVDVNEYFDDKRGLVKCKALGGGVVLIKTEVFKKTPQPWYGYIWNDNGSIKESNDWFFCHKAIESGFEVWCDSNIKAGHIGSKKY